MVGELVRQFHLLSTAYHAHSEAEDQIVRITPTTFSLRRRVSHLLLSTGLPHAAIKNIY
jgi:hypothetical protein